MIQELVRTFEIAFRFVKGATRYAKGGWVEQKLEPPDSKAFTMLEQLLLLARFEGEMLELQYQFEVKKMEPGPGSVEVKKGRRAHEQRLGPDDYRISSGRIHHDRLEAMIREALSGVEQKTIN